MDQSLEKMLSPLRFPFPSIVKIKLKLAVINTVTPFYTSIPLEPCIYTRSPSWPLKLKFFARFFYVAKELVVFLLPSLAVRFNDLDTIHNSCSGDFREVPTE